MPQTGLWGITEHWQSAQNRLGFALRNFIKGYGLPYQEQAEPKSALFLNQLEVLARQNDLLAQYDLQNLTDKATVSRYKETLTYLDWLDCFYQANPQAFQQILNASSVSCLDVGAKNWSYVEALTAFLQKYHIAFELHGLEIDPNRRYADFRTRKQYAEAYLESLPNSLQSKTYYHTGNILNWQQPVQIITHFLPFVFEEPHLDWGLPLSLFNPQAILNHELSLLQSDGILLIVNQGEDEAEAQQTLLEEAAKTASIRFQSLGQLPVRFVQYQYPRYGWICIKGD